MTLTGWKLSKKTRNAKAVLAEEQKRVSALPPTHPTWFNIDAAPSVLPAGHWCDITGLEAPYRTSSGLRFHDQEIYQIVKKMGPEVDQKYLKLRNAHFVLK